MHYIFDFDGTLADSKQCSILATQAAFKKCQLTIPTTEQIEYYMGIPIEQSFKEMAGQPFTEESFQQLLTTFRTFYKQYENETLQLFPNMKDVLHTLHRKKVNCFVVSSKKTDVLQRNLKALGIESFFTACIGSDQVKHYKPHPDGILTLLERFHLEAKDCVMIGDAIFDIQMGKAAKCQTCAVTWGSHCEEKLIKEQPDFIIRDVKELLQVEAIK